MSTQQQNDRELREDIAGLQLAIDSINDKSDRELESNVLGLMLLMIERIESRIQDRLENIDHPVS